MAISIDWATGVILVPKADMLLVQLTPIEVRELDLNDFRLALKDLEDSDDGMVFPKTHDHNTVVTVSGIQLARVIEILPPYTITFEDGPYAVNLVGANSNVADRINFNQVSVRSANSAGLIQTRELEVASFIEAVHIDQANGTSGTAYPSGTPRQPVNNLTDAQFISDLRGFTKFHFVGDFTFDSTTLLSGCTLIGDGFGRSTFTFEFGSIAALCHIEDARVTGTILGVTEFEDCHLINLTGSGLVPSSATLVLKHCVISKTLSLPSNYTGQIMALDCWGGREDNIVPVLEFNDAVASLFVRNYNGELMFQNFNSGGTIIFDLNSGHLTLAPSVVAGNFIVRGVGLITDNSTGSAIVDTSGLVTTEEGLAEIRARTALIPALL